MSSEDRLLRALAAPAAPAKDMHFMLEVMRRAEANRFRADAARRMTRGAGMAGIAAAALIGGSGWAAENADGLLNAGLVVMLGLLGAAWLRRRFALAR